MQLFDIKNVLSVGESSKDTASSARSLKFEALHTERIANIKQLCGRLPAQNELMMLWTLNSFNAFTFVIYIIKHVGSIDDLTFSTYSLNERILSSLCRWYDKGEIKKIKILISDSVRSRLPKLNDILQQQCANRNIEVAYGWNHSKIILMRVGDQHFLVEGSGNFSENALNEQYIFMQDERAYKFRKDCIDQVDI